MSMSAIQWNTLHIHIHIVFQAMNSKTVEILLLSWFTVSQLIIIWEIIHFRVQAYLELKNVNSDMIMK
jgi:hypothetical protein